MASGQMNLPPGFVLEENLPPGFVLEEPSLYERTLQGQQHMPEKIGEGVLSVLSSIPAAAAGGIAGLWTAAGNGPPGSGAQAVQDTVNRLVTQRLVPVRYYARMKMMVMMKPWLCMTHQKNILTATTMKTIL
jgi:hypothetical protein